MAKVVVFGDIDIASLYISIDGDKEVTVSGKYPRSFTLTAGAHHIAATTVSKIERMTHGWGNGGFLEAATEAMQNSTNTTFGGEVVFAEDDVLLLKVEQRGFKTEVYSKLLPKAEAEQYIDVDTALDFSAKPPKKWFLKVLLALGVLLGAMVVLLFLFVFTRKMG